MISRVLSPERGGASSRRPTGTPQFEIRQQRLMSHVHRFGQPIFADPPNPTEPISIEQPIQGSVRRLPEMVDGSSSTSPRRTNISMVSPVARRMAADSSASSTACSYGVLNMARTNSAD